jgi:hypothetical protein
LDTAPVFPDLTFGVFRAVRLRCVWGTPLI